MISKPLDQITGEDVESLIANAVAESRTLDYKEALNVQNDGDKKEFLNDVSSFANASGGDIIFGVREKRDARGPTGIPEAIIGLGQMNFDAEIRKFENLIRDGIEPRTKTQLRFVSTKFGDVLIVRILQSWSGPHMVTLGGSSRFFSRNSAGKYQLDVAEIRAAFIGSEAVPQRLQQFRNERLGKIVADEIPVGLEVGPRLVLHVLPVVAFGSRVQITQDVIAREWSSFHPLEQIANEVRYNIDGYLKVAKGPTANYGYVQVFRHGPIEAVDAQIIINSEGQDRWIPSLVVERALVVGCREYLRLLRVAEIEPPIAVSASLIGVKGYMLAAKRSMYPFERYAVDRDLVTLPDVWIEDYAKPVELALRPLFDGLWQAGGYPYCQHYDADGNFIGERNGAV